MNLAARLLILLAVLFLSPAAWADPTPEAGGTPTPEVTVPDDLIIHIYGERIGIAHKELSEDEVQNVRDRGDLGAALDQESGLETQGEGLGKSWNTLAIRGQSFRETVLLVNGQRVSENFDLDSIPTENIEKVEVLEGAEALVYGSDALGGVLNIVTRQGGDPNFNLQASGGDFNTYQLRGSLPTFSLGSLQNTLSGSWFTTDGYSPLPPGVGANGVTYLFTDEVHWDISHVATLTLGDDEATLSTGFFRHVGSAPDADNVIAAGTDQYDLDGRQDGWGLNSVLQFSHPMGSWKLTPSFFGNYSNVLRSNPIGADPTSGVYDPYRNQYLNYGGQVYAAGPVGGLLTQGTLGVEARDEDIASGLYGGHSRQMESLFTGGTLRLSGEAKVNLSNRLENYTGSGLVDNPAGSLVLDPSKGWQVHLSLGKGYRIPTYDQLYLPYTSFAALSPALLAQFSASPFAGAWAGDKGNPSLSPEESLDTELGTDITLGDCLLQLAGFANYYQNLIQPVVDPTDNFWTYTNLDHALFAGTEDVLRWHWGDWLMPYLSATWISATDQDGNFIQGRLRFKFAGGFDLKPEDRWSLGANARYVDRYPVATQYLTDLGRPAPPTDYWDFGLEAKYQVSKHLKGFLDVENLLNTPMASFQGIPLPGRYFQAGLQATF